MDYTSTETTNRTARDLFNRAAKFHPMTSEDTLPAVEISGVFVFVYVDDDGTLRVTVDTDTADGMPGWDSRVPMRINVNNATVFEGSDNEDVSVS